MRARLAMACMVISCGGGANRGDAGLPADDALLVDAATSSDAPSDGLPDATPDAPSDAPTVPPSYAVVETALEVRADIGKKVYAQVHVKNTGGTPLTFSFAVTGENKLKSEQRFASEGCTAQPGGECTGSVSFLPLVAGDRSAALTIHPSNSTLVDTVIPVVGRTYTLFSLSGYTGSVAGTITSSSPDVTCTGATCNGHFLDDLTVTATPMTGYVFVGWTDASCGSSPTCMVPRSTTVRKLGASFAPIRQGQLSLVMTGAPPGALVSVRDLSGFSQSVLAVCATNCTVPIPSELGFPTPTIRISVDTPRGSPAITGACTGADQCTFTAIPTAAATVSWTFDPKLPRTTVLDIGGLRSVARAANGDVFVSTLVQGNDGQWTVKLDANGNVLWAFPTTGQLIAQADGGVAISWPTSGLFAMQRLEVRDADGYLARQNFNQQVYASPTDNVEVDHFARTLAMGANAVFAMPGTKNMMSAIEAWGPFGSTIHWDASTAGAGARSITSDSGVFYLANATASGVSATKFSSAGANLGTVPGVAETVPLVMAVAADGDIVSTTGTSGTTGNGGAEAEVILRRVSATGVRRFERRVPSPATQPNRAGVVVLADGDAMWLHGIRGQTGGTYFATGIAAERISPTGTVVWSFTQGTSARSNVEVFDLGIAGDVPVAAGFYESLPFGTRAWIATFAP